MNLAGILALATLTGLGASANPQDAWILDGTRLCTFDANIDKPPTRCTQYYQVIHHKIANGKAWNEYRMMWKDSKFEVRYTTRVGSLGISQFTIGEVAYRNVGSSKFTKSQAVSYAPSRDELVIGIPDDGYQFTMKSPL